MAIILFMGKISGAHLNPAVSIAFALRRDFPWSRVPGYIVVQPAGATLAALVLHAIINVSASYGSNYPATGYSAGAAFWMELILTTGLVSVILGTASGAQNVGVIGAFGVGGYIALAGLWGSPISGASMNPARTFGPDLASVTFTSYWVYIAGPIAGAVIAVGIAFVLRGRAATSPRPGPPKASCSPRPTSPASPEDRDMSATSTARLARRAGQAGTEGREAAACSHPGTCHLQLGR
jgi:aquaporin Z